MFFLLIPVVLFLIIKKVFFTKITKSIDQKHVVITGGSSGIGLSFAILAAKQGAHVTILSRDHRKLTEALKHIRQARVRESQNVQSVAVDVVNYTLLEQTLNNVEETVGPIYMLVNCAGMAICATLEDMSIADIDKLVNVNFLGTVYPTKVVVSKMKQRKEGIIVITASQAALLGIYGMATYCGSKFALRGFAEALDMEVSAHNISVTVSLPPDTDTPGFQTENQSKPKETALICHGGGLFSPDEIAKKLLLDALGGHFFSSKGFESAITTILCVGMSRFSSFLEVILQMILLGPFRLIGCFYLMSFHRIIKNCLKEKEKCR